MINKFFALTTLLICSILFCKAQDNGDDLIGIWEPSSGKARVKIEKIGNKYYGKIVWLKEPLDPVNKQPKVDKNNPDESMRTVPLKGYRLLKDFEFKSKALWEDGTIYDPENGSTYNCTIKMKDKNTLDIRGYIGVSALGRTDVWKRLEIAKQEIKSN
ncbi:MAG: DUF2147 domain-containing protein [Bacteroidota bacterium]|jgi:uncharacterized protein (DUF2147 family)|nr:hypothetical protein LBMAG25_00760 [Bacteroidota bacterium]